MGTHRGAVDVQTAKTRGTHYDETAMIDEPYRETAPPAALAAYVDRFWSRTTAQATGDGHRVLPDGCVDLLVDLEAGTAELVGPMSRAALVPATAARIVAARFRPGAAARFAGVPLASLVDESVPTSEVAIDARGLVGALVVAGSERERLALLATFVRARLADADPIDRLVRHAVEKLTRSSRPSVGTLASELGVSRQYLARVFAHDVGVTPKALARIARMQRVVLAMRRGRRDWARLAHELGFSDQSHLVNEATELTGISPTALAAEVSISPIASIYDGARASP
jgi:AraC-like DNA-binding protein